MTDRACVRLSFERAMPQSVHITLPSSRWSWSGLFVPPIDRSRFVRSFTSRSASFTAGCEVSIFAIPPRAM